MAELKLDQRVNVAVRSEIIAQDRAEQRELPNVINSAKFGELRVINRNPLTR